MTRKPIAFTTMIFCILALPLTVWADSRTYTPPPRKGTIYVIVRFVNNDGIGIVGQNTSVSVRWGNWNMNGTWSPGTRRTPKDGVVISLKHSKDDSVPLTVNTSTHGRIMNVYQGDPPGEWSDGNWYKVSW
jgi:hypothetical protein